MNWHVEFSDPPAIHELPGRQTGLIAREVERVFAAWVEDGADGSRRLAPRGFEALTVEALRKVRDEKDRQVTTRSTELSRLLAEREVERATVERLREQLERLDERFDALVERRTSLEASARD